MVQTIECHQWTEAWRYNLCQDCQQSKQSLGFFSYKNKMNNLWCVRQKHWTLSQHPLSSENVSIHTSSTIKKTKWITSPLLKFSCFPFKNLHCTFLTSIWSTCSPPLLTRVIQPHLISAAHKLSFHQPSFSFLKNKKQTVFSLFMTLQLQIKSALKNTALELIKKRLEVLHFQSGASIKYWFLTKKNETKLNPNEPNFHYLYDS